MKDSKYGPLIPNSVIEDEPECRTILEKEVQIAIRITIQGLVDDVYQSFGVLIFYYLQGHPHIFRVEHGAQQHEEIPPECVKAVPLRAFDLIMIFIACYLLAKSPCLIL